MGLLGEITFMGFRLLAFILIVLIQLPTQLGASDIYDHPVHRSIRTRSKNPADRKKELNGLPAKLLMPSGDFQTQYTHGGRLYHRTRDAKTAQGNMQHGFTIGYMALVGATDQGWGVWSAADIAKAIPKRFGVEYDMGVPPLPKDSLVHVLYPIDDSRVRILPYDEVYDHPFIQKISAKHPNHNGTIKELIQDHGIDIVVRTAKGFPEIILGNRWAFSMATNWKGLRQTHLEIYQSSEYPVYIRAWAFRAAHYIGVEKLGMKPLANKSIGLAPILLSQVGTSKSFRSNNAILQLFGLFEDGFDRSFLRRFARWAAGKNSYRRNAAQSFFERNSSLAIDYLPTLSKIDDISFLSDIAYGNVDTRRYYFEHFEENPKNFGNALGGVFREKTPTPWELSTIKELVVSQKADIRWEALAMIQKIRDTKALVAIGKVIGPRLDSSRPENGFMLNFLEKRELGTTFLPALEAHLKQERALGRETFSLEKDIEEMKSRSACRKKLAV